MHTTAIPSTPTNWTGRIVLGLTALFLLFDTVVKLVQSPQAVEPTVALGFSPALVMPIGLIQLICLILYLIPRTTVVGAVLLTGYLGGAVATQLAASSPLFSIIFPLIIGALVWLGAYLRNQPLRDFVGAI